MSEQGHSTKTGTNRWMQVLLVGSAVYAALRVTASVVHFLTGHARFQNDIRLHYDWWLAFIDPDRSHRVIDSLGYLPHVWILLTPLFLCGWRVTAVVWFLCQFVLHAFICLRIARLVRLEGSARLLFCAYYWSVLGVGLTIALGNIGVAAFAALLAAYPFVPTSANTALLTLSTVKHTLVYPVFLRLLLGRWKAVVPALVIVAATVLAAYGWAGVNPFAMAHGLDRAYRASQSWLTQSMPVSYVPFFQAVLGHGTVATVAGWCVWFALFIAVWRLVQDEVIQLAALVLIGLLPMYHRGYDLFVAGLALGVFLQQGRLLAASLLTLALAGLYDAAAKRGFFGLTFLQGTQLWYYPAVILVTVTALVVLDHRRRRPAPSTAQRRRGSWWRTEPMAKARPL